MTGLISSLEIADGDPLEPPAPAEPTDVAQAGDDLSLVRDLVLKAHPNVVPELIGGDSVASIVASISPAQAAYADLAARIQASSVPNSVSGSAPNSVSSSAPGSAGGAPRVPAGSAAPAPIDPDRIPTAEKIRRGVRDHAARTASRSTSRGAYGGASRIAR